MCEAAAAAAAADGECLDVGTWDACACCVEFLFLFVLAVVCTEGVVHCDFPDGVGHAGSLANQSSSSGPSMEEEVLSWVLALLLSS